MNYKYLNYLSASEKLFFLLNIFALLALVVIFIKGGFAAFGIDAGLFLLAILKTHFTLIALGMQRIPTKQQDEKVKAFIQQAEKFPWLYKKGGIKGALLAWGVAVGWVVFASVLFKLFLST